MEPQPQVSAGRMIVVVGPSGAGKDTLMAAAAERFAGDPRLHVVRRVITRPSDAGGEDFDGVDIEEFERRQASGDFAVHWQAHGLHYGIPRDACGCVEAGQLVIANGSRSALKHFQKAFPHLLVLNIVASKAVLAERLFARGRESREDIEQRLQRGDLGVKGDFEVVTIDNSGPLDRSVADMTALLGDLLARLPKPGPMA